MCIRDRCNRPMQGMPRKKSRRAEKRTGTSKTVAAGLLAQAEEPVASDVEEADHEIIALFINRAQVRAPARRRELGFELQLTSNSIKVKPVLSGLRADGWTYEQSFMLRCGVAGSQDGLYYQSPRKLQPDCAPPSKRRLVTTCSRFGGGGLKTLHAWPPGSRAASRTRRLKRLELGQPSPRRS